jgi:hypothetical protein
MFGGKARKFVNNGENVLKYWASMQIFDKLENKLRGKHSCLLLSTVSYR